ncbi:HAD hydrolase, family IA, variant 3 [Prevotella sp. BV3P1]|uniref:HAD family hydrolase n=1 Tax=Prevotellaceae TaxID=171552 RepID=UPI0003B812B7|nr:MULTISPECIES: HAD family phosphatase [Prevotellaceae]ERT57672.1 HAD hydrolase, family IA, variant 3 [Prevotella sp. BV3P1]KGF41161.1 phosphatase [Hoylesella buccalis DNF00985]
MFNTALFDLDGVVLDTESQYTVCWDRIGKVYKPDIPHFAHLIKGQTLNQIFNRYFKDEEEAQHEIENQLIEFEKSMDYAYIPGVVAFITDLKRYQVNMAIVTSSNQQKMTNVYQRHPEFEVFFDVILTSEDFKRSKPDPDCYLTAAAHFSVSHNQCVVFEDSINGLKAGNAAQMKVCGLATTNSVEVIEPLSDMVMNDFVGVSYEKLSAMI